MRASVIIPLYNEEKTLPALLRNLERLKGEAEILFVDGGSTDGSLSILRRSPYRVLEGPRGRARQMNYGAVQSTGEILLFLHCDSELPVKPLAEMERVLKTHQWGCFGIAFREWNPWLKCCQLISNRRVLGVRRIAFGDQGIFIERELFMEIGGFPELPIMEDYQFSLMLKARRIYPGMTRKRIYTSARRFQRGGMLRTMWKMNRLRARYRRGDSILDIAKEYRDVR